MKIKKKISKKKIIIPIIVLIALLAGGTAWAYMAQVGPFAKEQITKHKPKKSKKEDKEQDESTDNSPEDSSDKALRPSPGNDSSGDIEKPSITVAEQSGDTIRISAMLSKSSSGSCILKISKPGQATIQRSAPIIVGPSYYACNGFRLTRSEFPAAGQWSVVVTHELNGKSIDSDRKGLDVR